MNIRKILLDIYAIICRAIVYLSGFYAEDNELNTEVFRRLSEEIKINPNDPHLYLRRTNAFRKFRPNLKQIADFSKIIELVSGNEEQYPDINIRHIYELRSAEYKFTGVDRFYNGKLDEARRYYQLAIADFERIYPSDGNPSEQYQNELKHLQDALKEIDATLE
jgi:tetratricopeptide (TPR) repeat protein